MRSLVKRLNFGPTVDDLGLALASVVTRPRNMALRCIYSSTVERLSLHLK